jgi:hypothetical protein
MAIKPRHESIAETQAEHLINHHQWLDDEQARTLFVLKRINWSFF